MGALGMVEQRQVSEVPAGRDDGITQIELSRFTPSGNIPRLWVLYSWFGN